MREGTESGDKAGPFTWEKDRQGRREHRDGEKFHFHQDPRMLLLLL